MDNSKTDLDLGIKVAEYLTQKGVQTPMVATQLEVPDEFKLKQIEMHVRNILMIIGLDLDDDSLIDTPKRVAKMYVNETFAGLKAENFPKSTVVDNKMKYSGVVLESPVAVKSVCEHHIITIDGYATVAYIPGDKVLGLSKLNRIVNYFCRRPQIQERLTEQIFHALVYILGTEDVAVHIDAKHYCVSHRGIEDVNSRTDTAKLGGAFFNNASTRAEFYAGIKRK